MAKGRRSKRKQEENKGHVVKKTIEKRSAKKKKAPVTPAAPVTPVTPADPVTPVVASGAEVSVQGKTEKKSDKQIISGFIFMCNAQTKSECYKYRVFGLPPGKLDVVERIRKDTKLFLFDCDVKLLYGLYMATSNGARGLEQAAFGGRFPAQVRFKILKDCLPVPESVFRHAIQDNYDGRKFRPELDRKQVKKLSALFRPVTLPPTGQASYPPPTVVSPHANPPPVVGSYPVASHVGRVPPPREAWYSQPAQHEAYYPEHRVPYMIENPGLYAQDSYGRYRDVPSERVQRDGFEYQHVPREREPLHMDRADGYYRSASRAPVPSYAPAPGDYYSNAAYENPSRAYGEPLSRSAAAMAGQAGGNAPVSAFYSFAGPAPTYR